MTKYEVTIKQEVVHRGTAAGKAERTSTEELKGATTNFEDVHTIIGLIEAMFPNTHIEITIDNNKEEN